LLEEAMVSSTTYDRFEGERNLLVVFAPSEEDDRFDGQLLCLNDFKEGVLQRDVTVYTVVGVGESTAAGEPLSQVEVDSLRMRFGASDDEFLVVLVGKDGTEKMRWTEPAPPGVLLDAIDDVDRREEQAGRSPHRDG
jgi:hypothetical protein